jgi:hypothetical protein
MYKIFSTRTNTVISEAKTIEEANDIIYELEMLDHNNGIYFPKTYICIKS